MKRTFKFLSRALCAVAVLSFAFVAGGCDKEDKKTNDGESKFVITNAPEGFTTFALGETKSFDVDAVNITEVSVSAPNGWGASYADKKLTVVAPSTLKGVETTGEVSARYKGTNGLAGRVSLRVQVSNTTDPDPDPDPEPTPDPVGSFSIQATVDGTTVNFRIVPDDPTAKFWIGFDAEANYAQYPTPEEYVAYDINYWLQQYGAENFASRLASGPIEDKFTGVDVAGSYIVYAYYVSDDLSKGSGFSKVTVKVTEGTIEPEKPALNLQYDLGDAGQFQQPGKGAVVAYIEPTNSVSDWYYGSFLAETANNMTDDQIRAALKAGSDRDKDEYHGKNFGLYIYEWNTKIVLCGFYVDAEGNEGPIERVPLIVSLTGGGDWNYGDYLGDWTVSGKNAAGKEVSFDISIEENMYNESYKIFGFTRTGYDKKYNAPTRANFKNGQIEFYENALLGIDQETDNFLGFLGYAYEVGNESNVGYFNIDHNVIAYGLRANNTIEINWQQFTWNGDGKEHTLQYYAFLYGYFTEDEVRNQYFHLYDADNDSIITSDIIFTKKNTPSKSHRKTFVKQGLAKR